jgi:hypothetical protein
VLVEEEEGKGGWLVLGVELEDSVEAATLVLGVAGFGGQPEPALDEEHAGTGEVLDDKLSQERPELVDHWLRWGRVSPSPSDGAWRVACGVSRGAPIVMASINCWTVGSRGGTWCVASADEWWDAAPPLRLHSGTEGFEPLSTFDVLGLVSGDTLYCGICNNRLLCQK